MKKLVCLLALVVAGCSQEYLDQKAAERDHAWCESMGVRQGSYGYQDCRMTAAQNRIYEKQHKDAIALGMMGVGSGIYQSATPRQPTTCTTLGYSMTCN